MEYNRLVELINQDISYMEISKIFNCSKSTVKYWVKKHGLAKENDPIEYAKLAELVSEGLSEREMSRRLNCSRGKVAYWMQRLGFTKVNLNCKCKYCKKELARRQGKFCNSQCQNDFSLMSLINSGSYSAQTAKRYLKRLDYRCAVCKNDTWMGKPLDLELDHIDGNSTNNDLKNLRLICPNCHSQTHTYKNKNKGKGRHTRMLRYREGKSY